MKHYPYSGNVKIGRTRSQQEASGICFLHWSELWLWVAPRRKDRLLWQFGIDDKGKTLYWNDQKIPITATRGCFRFLALSSLATNYGEGERYALHRPLGLTGYTLGLSSDVEKALRQTDKVLPSNIENLRVRFVARNKLRPPQIRNRLQSWSHLIISCLRPLVSSRL